MINPYAENIDSGLAAMRHWAETQETLPDDPWKLPKDCPIWKMGLSLAQAAGILSRVRSEKQ